MRNDHLNLVEKFLPQIQELFVWAPRGSAEGSTWSEVLTRMREETDKGGASSTQRWLDDPKNGHTRLARTQAAYLQRWLVIGADSIRPFFDQPTVRGPASTEETLAWLEALKHALDDPNRDHIYGRHGQRAGAFARSAEHSFAMTVLAEPDYDTFAVERGLPLRRLDGVSVSDWLKDLLYTRYTRGGPTKSQLAADFGLNPTAASYMIQAPEAVRLSGPSNRLSQTTEIPDVEIRAHPEHVEYPSGGSNWSPMDRILLQIGWILATIRIKDEYVGNRTDFYNEDLELYGEDLLVTLQAYPEFRELTSRLLHQSRHSEIKDLIKIFDL